MQPWTRVYCRRFLIAGAAILLGMSVTARWCYADDAATLDSWQANFNAVWQADSCAQEFQSWSNYWARVHDFYFGGRGSTGWFADSQTILSHVTDPAARSSISSELTALGQRVGGEWAKADGCRKIRTGSSGLQKMLDPGKPALTDFEKRLNNAAIADSGNGQSIEATIKSISHLLDQLGVANS
ncbi:MAG: hypothetical protein JO003_06445 [Candidatus Eremiobacteraeota bacterium]|nr:hypothetical protein [Candidatus Eremiobacteraeota bacterium]